MKNLLPDDISDSLEYFFDASTKAKYLSFAAPSEGSNIVVSSYLPNESTGYVGQVQYMTDEGILEFIQETEKENFAD